MEGINHHAVAESLEGSLCKAFGEQVGDLAVCGHVDELCGLVGHKLLDLVILDVDVLHATMKNRIFGTFDASDIVFVEHGRDFGVEELLRHLWRLEIFWNKEAVDAGSSEFVVLAK